MDAIPLSKKEFIQLKDLVYAISGIHLHEGKTELLKSKISKRMRMTKQTLKSYLDLLHSDEKELIEFIDTVTTNHSYFFRENRNIQYIVNQFALQPHKAAKKFNLWCAACSTGDEPYSTAIQLKEAGLSFSILATDISHSVLATARQGIYRQDKTQNVPQPLLHKYFQKGRGKYEGFLKIKKEIQDHIVFQKFNLISDAVPSVEFDAVLCRNVMIYFDVKTSETVVNKLYRGIVPGGFFAIGNAESLMNMKHRFQSIRQIPSLYVK